MKKLYILAARLPNVFSTVSAVLLAGKSLRENLGGGNL
jgi:hypothetical protein